MWMQEFSCLEFTLPWDHTGCMQNCHPAEVLCNCLIPFPLLSSFFSFISLLSFLLLHVSVLHLSFTFLCSFTLLKASCQCLVNVLISVGRGSSRTVHLRPLGPAGSDQGGGERQSPVGPSVLSLQTLHPRFFLGSFGGLLE